MSTSVLRGIRGYFYCDNPEEHTGNFCADQPWYTPDRAVDGEVIFVRTNCGDRSPPDPSQQDPIYQKLGVPMDRGKLADLLDGWEKASCDLCRTGECLETSRCPNRA